MYYPVEEYAPTEADWADAAYQFAEWDAERKENEERNDNR